MSSYEQAIALVQGLPDAAVALDRDLGLVAHNVSFTELIGMRPRVLREALKKAGSIFRVLGDERAAEHARQAMETQRALRLHEIEVDLPDGSRRTAIVSFIPIIAPDGGAPIGVIYSIRDVSAEARVQGRYRKLLEAERARTEAHRSTAVDTVFRLAVAAEYRDDDTGFHLHRMSDYAQLIAESLGLDRTKCDLIKLASPMHDVGKIGIPDSILKKPGPLGDVEWAIMKSHTEKGAAILANSESELLQMACNVALCHHEWHDGTGYPRRIGGSDIPLEGRIVAVADVFDAVRSRRCYKPGLSHGYAVRVLRDQAGTHFDPRMVEAFLDAEQRVLEILGQYEELEERRGFGTSEVRLTSLPLGFSPQALA